MVSLLMHICVIRPQWVNYLHLVRYNFCTHPVSQWPRLGAFGYTDRCLGYPGISRRCIPMFHVCFPACARSHGTFGAESGLAAGERHGGRRGVPVPISTWIMPSPNDDGSVVYDVYFNVIYLWDWPFTDTFHDDTGNKTEELLKLILVRYSKWSQCKFYRRTSLPFF